MGLTDALLPAMPVDRFLLYEAAVQDVRFDLRFFQRVYRRIRGRAFHALREDFCGGAQLACTWVAHGRDRFAIGVDRSRAALAWARAHHLAALGEAAERVALVRADVRRSGAPPVDVIAALNCSYWVFRRRTELLDYLRAARHGLRRGGLLFLDVFGGEDTMRKLTERRRVRARRTERGERIPPFTYVWEQRSFNPVDHHLLADIHFEFANARRMRRAFTYDWRMWMLPELNDALREAGFADVQVYVQGWDDEGHRPLDVFTRRTRFANEDAWIAYVVGVR
jgi:SAM-dependent methyltransferase